MLSSFGVSLENASGHPVLNIPDAPQSLTLTLVNRGATDLVMSGVSSREPEEQFHVRLRFRPHSLRNLGGIQLGGPSRALWRLEAGVDQDHTQVLTLRLMRRLVWKPGETELVYLDGMSAEPRGGTRTTRIEASFANFVERDGGSGRAVEGHHVIQTLIARSKVGASDAARRLRSGSAARSGPLTAGFVDGPAVLGDGESLSQLRLRIVNTSSSPIHLSADDDEASRIEFGYRTSTMTAPWGLLHGHSDHLTATLHEPGEDEPDPDGTRSAMVEPSFWQIDGSTIRCAEAHTWGPGGFVDIDLDIHSSAPPGDVQLILRVVDVPSMDDCELILLAHVAPLAVFPDAIAATRPIELWSGGRLDFHASGFVGRDRSSTTGAAPLPRTWSSIGAASDGALVIDGRPEVRIPTRLHLTEPSQNEAAGQLIIGPTDASNLRLGTYPTYSWIQSHLKELRINPSGNAVSVGTVKPEYGALSVQDRIEIHGVMASQQETRDQRNTRNHLVLARSDRGSVIQPVAGPLHINAAGQPVTIGVAESRGHGLTVGGAMRIVGRTGDGYMLSLTRPAQRTLGEVDSLSFGYASNHSFITSPPNQHLALNTLGGRVVIGNVAPQTDTLLTIGGDMYVQDNVVVHGSLQIGTWRLEDRQDIFNTWRLFAISTVSPYTEVELAMDDQRPSNA